MNPSSCILAMSSTVFSMSPSADSSQGGFYHEPAQVEIVEHLQLADIAALLSATAHLGTGVEYQPDVARPLYQTVEVICPD